MLKPRRRHKRLPYVIGLTGSIATGKSTIASMFRRLGVKVCDSDKIVHRLLASGGKAVEKVAALFPETRSEYGIDRKALGKEVFANPTALAELEAVLHPLVRAEQERFLRVMRRMGVKIVLLDIPLLFETGAEKRCDKVVVAHCPAFLQRQRALRRTGMTTEKLRHILRRQLPMHEKRMRADMVINTGLGRAVSWKKVMGIIRTRLN